MGGLQEGKKKNGKGHTVVLRCGKVDLADLAELVCQTERLVFDEGAVSDVRVKGAADFVTRVDMEVQNFLQKELERRYPGIGFIGEEAPFGGVSREQACWILDPIDGTTNLIHHYQMSAVSLGLYEDGRIMLGIVYNPFSKELYTAVAGQGAYRNGQRIQVSDTDCPEDALICYGSNPYDKSGAHEMFALYERLFLACTDFRRSGSAALDLCYVACGRQDAYLEPNLKPWDYAAGALILQEAGGKIGTWVEGEELNYLKPNAIFATNGKLDEGLRKIICKK